MANTGTDGPRWDALWLGADLATMNSAADPADPLGVVRDGALAVAGDRIAWVGRRVDLPGDPADLAAVVHDLNGAWLTPGLIDCHTHLIYGGDRAEEFRLRLHGASYEAIAAAGGGILSTVRATRALGEEALLAAARPRLAALAAEGVTTVEIKSGYGLDIETELRMLRAAVRLGGESGLRMVPTLLAAHAIPPDHAADPDAYVGLICDELIPAAVGLAHAVDAFGERIAFSPPQVARVFEAARRHGLPVKLHADQLSDQGGGALAARFGALSADHLEYLGEDGVAAMAAAGTVAVLLPGAFYTLRETRLPPIEALRRAGVPIALATDCNPGTSPATSLLLMLNMGCTLFRLTPEEALAGVTVHAARALGLSERIGRLAPGLQADFVAWDIASPAELAYRIGFNPARHVVAGGTVQPCRAQSSTVSSTARSIT